MPITGRLRARGTARGAAELTTRSSVARKSTSSSIPSITASTMVPGATPYPGAIPALAGIPAMPGASQEQAQAVQSVYNPTPPVRPAVRKTAGCLGIVAGAVGLFLLACVLFVAFADR